MTNENCYKLFESELDKFASILSVLGSCRQTCSRPVQFTLKMLAAIFFRLACKKHSCFFLAIVKCEKNLFLMQILQEYDREMDFYTDIPIWRENPNIQLPCQQ